MKKVLVLLGLIGSMSVSAETIKTDNPNMYLKNYICEANGDATFNAVNKSTDEYWQYIRFRIYDSDGDPIDNFAWFISLLPKTGKKITRGSCLKLKGATYTVEVL